MSKKFIVIALLAVLAVFCLTFAACQPSEEGKELTLKSETNSYEIDVYQTTYVAIELPKLFNESIEGLSYDVQADSDHITTSRVSSTGKLNIISDGTLGQYKVSVSVMLENEELLNFDITVSVIDGAPAPSLKQNLPNVSFDVPVFPDTDQGTTYFEYNLDLSKYFDAADNISYEIECADSTVTLTSDAVKPYLVQITFGQAGTKEITVYAVQSGVRVVSSTFTATLTPSTPNQLINGDFEQGFTGWNLDLWGRAAYSIYDSNVDIFGNGVDNDGSYLYGYYDEHGTCEFTSSLFTLQGTGDITWKMCGNCTDDLQFILMKYVEGGDDVEIAKFNNWYYGKYPGSGFIFREYYYKAAADLIGSTCYFKVVDHHSDEFAFVNLDSIRTYYTSSPNTADMYKAGFCTDPDGKPLDMSDTSGNAFPSDLSGIAYQLQNGDFEDGYTGWYMTAEEKAAYAIFGSRTDIWNNRVNNTGNYLYGYQKESFASANFHSSLFKVGGMGLITWKMAGNSTADLQFILMKYNPDGEDEKIATFNNWYFPISHESGFIFRNYRYQIDLDKYEGSYCYFVVKDNRNADFGFICLDDIVTYYDKQPDLQGEWFDAGFCTDPSAAQ